MSWVQLPYDYPKKEIARKMRKEMTPPEKILWYNFLSGRKPPWRRQKIIWPFIADFYCPWKQIVIEVDGDIHSEQRDYDNERDSYIQSHGIQIIRIPARNIFQNLDGVCDYLEQFL